MGFESVMSVKKTENRPAQTLDLRLLHTAGKQEERSPVARRTTSACVLREALVPDVGADVREPVLAVR